MAQAAPKHQTTDTPLDDLAAEAQELRERYLEKAGDAPEGDQSPQAFYERSVAREDMREILERLARI
jgi:hypothetical protein